MIPHQQHLQCSTQQQIGPACWLVPPLELVRQFDVTVDRGADVATIHLAGWLAADAARALQHAWISLRRDPQPCILDCTRLTGIDDTGGRQLVELLRASPQLRISNVPAHIAPVLRGAGLGEMLRSRCRHTVAVITLGGVDVVSAARMAEVFETANDANCSYETATMAFEPTTCITVAPRHRWHTLVIPPIDRWLGLDAAMPVVRWVAGHVESADKVLAIGSGSFLLAAAGQLVDVDVTVDRHHAPMLSVLAPRASVLAGLRSRRAGRCWTACDADGAVEAALSIIADDYGRTSHDATRARLAQKSSSVTGEQRAFARSESLRASAEPTRRCQL